RKDGLSRIDEFEARHVEETGTKLLQRSQVVADAVKANKLALVYLTYKLADGRVVLHGHVGDIDNS
ncbi:carbonic anhydrase, partial [Mycobacteroides immunogenum]